MKAVLDVGYGEVRATAVCLVYRAWPDSEPAGVVRETVPVPARYRAGRFFERELPCLMAVLDRAGQRFDTIVIDGYVHLRADRGPGLGARLAAEIGYRAVIIGVAKSPLAIADRAVAITRGRSCKPLFISAIGCPPEVAARRVASMHGPYRIPTLLRLADRLAREAEQGAGEPTGGDQKPTAADRITNVASPPRSKP